jgi:predicted kinase
MLRNKVFQWFMENHSDLVNRMRTTYHSYDDGSLSPYHLEDDVWAHTCMVYHGLTDHLLRKYTESEKEILFLAALVHDIGKIYTRTVLPTGRVTFKGHDRISAVEAYEVLKDYPFIKPSLAEESIITIMLLVQVHTLYYQLKKPIDIYEYLNYDGRLFDLFKVLAHVDHFGQMRAPDAKYDAKQLTWGTEFPQPSSTPFNKQLILMCGPPGSGKDTLIKNDQRYGNCVSSFDEIRWNLYEEHYGKVERNAETYNKVFEFAKEKNNDLLNIMRKEIKSLFDSSDVVYISNTNLTRKSRRKFVGIARDLKVEIHAIFVWASLQELIERDLGRGDNDKTVGEAVIRQMRHHTDMPVMGEGFHSVRYILGD